MLYEVITLIGRESEGALNLEYFINPWPDTTTSPTNELSTSTGGVFMDDPLQLEHPQLRGGVCGMCVITSYSIHYTKLYDR